MSTTFKQQKIRCSEVKKMRLGKPEALNSKYDSADTQISDLIIYARVNKSEFQNPKVFSGSDLDY